MKSNKILVWVVTLIYLASQIHLAYMVNSLKPSLVQLQLTFTAAGFWGIIEQWKTEGLLIYLSHFSWDLFHVLAYSAFGIVMVQQTTFFKKFSPVWYRFFLAALPVAGIMDLIENELHLYIITLPHGTATTLVPLAATCSLIKWILALGFMGTLLKQLFTNLLGFRIL
ncbi:hypothetical protein SAMN05421780_10520 [Flexibacter flexilis DSM 6793]|uniref:Uncharacterized protein n=1 Tax=Flexibacter flexilis DSM 6793 TaxID=927664 RepID=A0A1I1IVW3_9BACT|nr:hypothetical protein [Flexibacter flexilis]SFC37360.1 hypothetical protein SAMN05421780_10520 [Flexibacter flexilis DSM 6793]